jgi:hypothetical protein
VTLLSPFARCFSSASMPTGVFSSFWALTARDNLGRVRVALSRFAAVVGSMLAI